MRQLLSPCNVPEGHLSLIFRDSPKVKYFVLFFFSMYMHSPVGSNPLSVHVPPSALITPSLETTGDLSLGRVAPCLLPGAFLLTNF